MPEGREGERSKLKSGTGGVGSPAGGSILALNFKHILQFDNTYVLFIDMLLLHMKFAYYYLPFSSRVEPSSGGMNEYICLSWKDVTVSLWHTPTL